MNERPRPVFRALKIILVVGLMAAAVWVIGERVRARMAMHPPGEPYEPVLEQIRHESHIKTTSAWTVEANPNATVRDLATVYERRAYPGAPPMIPHELATVGIGANACNTCHQHGGFVEKFNAHAPVTPHPHYESCTQCHVPSNTEDLFRKTDWASVQPAAIHRPALPGSPPPIPHTLQLRENCISCHAGPAAPREVRTSHPERENCVQCHVPVETPTLFERPALANLGDRKE